MSDLGAHIRDIPDFPKPGIVFKDITPLLAAREAFAFTVRQICDHYVDAAVTKVLGIEARGFIPAAPIAYRIGASFIPVRKAGKLPWQVIREEYSLEYGNDRLEVHRDAIPPGERVLVVDDVLATGGTAAATAALVERCGGKVAGIATIMELTFLNGRSRLEGYELLSVLAY